MLNCSDRKDIALLIEGDLSALGHYLPHRLFVQELQQAVLIEKALELPEKADELAAEPGRQLDADADMDVEDGPGLK